MSVNILTGNGLKKVDGGAASEAKGIAYNPTTSGLAADDVQEAIDEINGNLSDKQDKTDNGIKTNAKTVVGAINELLNGLITKQEKEDSALVTTAKSIVGAINELLGKFTSYYTKTESNNLLAAKQNTLAATQIWNGSVTAIHNGGMSGWKAFNVGNYKYIFMMCGANDTCVSTIIPCDVIRRIGTILVTTAAKPTVLYSGNTFLGQWTVHSTTQIDVYVASGVHLQLFGVY